MSAPPDFRAPVTTARWRRGRIGVDLVVDGEVAVTVARNGAWWRAWGDVSSTHPTSRKAVIDDVLRACEEAGIVVENAPPADNL